MAGMRALMDPTLLCLRKAGRRGSRTGVMLTLNRPIQIWRLEVSTWRGMSNRALVSLTVGAAPDLVATTVQV